MHAAFPELAAEGPPDHFLPAAIHNLERVDAIPVMLAGVLVVLGLLSVTHVLATSTRSQRRDLAILRSLGASGGWVERAVHWQATLFTALCAALGIPLGVVVGRQVFTAFADNMGVVDDPAFPIAWIAVGAAGIAVVANVAAAIPARHARRMRAAALLNAE
jgi:predicted lysophospholipase L1 biosynthesis ABC-type transport system permease subunit